MRSCPSKQYLPRAATDAVYYEESEASTALKSVKHKLSLLLCATTVEVQDEQKRRLGSNGEGYSQTPTCDPVEGRSCAIPQYQDKNYINIAIRTRSAVKILMHMRCAGRQLGFSQTLHLGKQA
jgi:hypothetical protein